MENATGEETMKSFGNERASESVKIFHEFVFNKAKDKSVAKNTTKSS